MYHYLPKMPLFDLFCCNPDPDADFCFDPDADFDQDGPRYTKLTVMYHYWALFGLKYHYLGYFAVIRIQMRIFDPDADFEQDGPIYIELTLM